MKLGIIGTGNLAESMVSNFLKNRAVSGADISVYDVDDNKLNYWAGTYDVIPCTDLDSVVQNSHILFVAVSWQSFQKLLPNVDFLLKTYRPLLVTLTRGISLEEIEDMMEFITPMARVVTNLNIGIGTGITAYCFNELVTDDQKGSLIELFSSTGQLVEIEEQYFDAFGAVSTMASALTCSLIETLTTCGIQEGLSAEMAMKTAVQCIYGASKTITDTKTTASAMLQKLCPPQSMTVDGVMAYKEKGFDKAVIGGFKAAMVNKK